MILSSQWHGYDYAHLWHRGAAKPFSYSPRLCLMGVVMSDRNPAEPFVSSRLCVRKSETDGADRPALHGQHHSEQPRVPLRVLVFRTPPAREILAQALRARGRACGRLVDREGQGVGERWKRNTSSCGSGLSLFIRTATTIPPSPSHR